MIALSNIAQGSAVLGMIALQRKNAEAQEVNVPACISCYLGVTEPAIFGVNLKHVFPFVCGMIGSACAAVVCVAMGTTANAIGVGGLPGILSIRPDSMIGFAICMVIAVVVPFVLTVFVGKRKLTFAQKSNVPVAEPEEITSDAGVSAATGAAASAERRKENQKKELKAFLTGKVIGLKEVNDGVFSEGVMGEGIAIVPEDNILYAPADAVVNILMQDSEHACGLTMDNGMEILLHVGIDTVDMQGDGFQYLVEEGQQVSVGMPLIRFDRDKIKASGHSDTTVCIITEPGNAENIQFFTGVQGKAKVTVVAAYE